MKLGFVSAILPDLDLGEVLRFAAATGYDCVELMCWPVGRAERRYAGVTHLDVTGLTAAEARRVGEQAAVAGVEISSLGYYPNPLSPNPEEARSACHHLLRVMDAAAILGLKCVNTFIGRDPSLSVEENWPRMLAAWEPLVRHAAERDLRIGIENCPMLFTGDEWPGGKNLAVSPAIWRRLFAAFPGDTLGLNYDPSHMVWQMMDESAPIREFADRLVHVHAKDVRVDRRRLNEVGILAHPLEYHTPKLPGLGEVDWSAFFAALTDVGYDGPVCVEVEDRAYEGSLDGRKAALRQSHQYLRNFIPGRGG